MSQLTVLLSLVKTTAQGVSGLTAARVFQGRKVYAENDTSLEKAVQALTDHTQGVFAFWLAPRSSGNRMTVQGSATIAGELYVKRPKDSSNDLAGEYGFCEALASALSDLTTFAAFPANDVMYEDTHDDLEDGIAVFSFTMNYRVPMC